MPQKKPKSKKPISLDEYRNTKEFEDAIKSGELYGQLKPKKNDPEKDKKFIPKLVE